MDAIVWGPLECKAPTAKWAKPGTSVWEAGEGFSSATFIIEQLPYDYLRCCGDIECDISPALRGPEMCLDP